jgi:hypothetical protein
MKSILKFLFIFPFAWPIKNFFSIKGATRTARLTHGKGSAEESMKFLFLEFLPWVFVCLLHSLWLIPLGLYLDLW